jgi:hypothetical protein
VVIVIVIVICRIFPIVQLSSSLLSDDLNDSMFSAGVFHKVWHWRSHAISNRQLNTQRGNQEIRK